MKFDELDTTMRVFETAHDHCVLPGIYIVARLDGRSFTRLTKDVCDFEAPFDERFRDMMAETTRHLMENVGLQFIYTSAGLGENQSGTVQSNSASGYSFGTSLQGEPWDIFLGSLTAFYYFG